MRSSAIRNLWQFVAFIVTVPPVFHGMERSLDLRYLERTSRVPGAMRIMGDTAVIVLTGLFFLGLALSIPDHGQQFLAERTDGLRHYYRTLLVAFFVYDAVVLVVTGLRLRRTVPHTRTTLSHIGLAMLNGLAALAVALTICFATRTWFIAVIATVRSVMDYAISRRLLFPREELESS